MISLRIVNKISNFSLSFLILFSLFSSTISKSQVQENELTLDKVRVITHVYSGKCMIIENKPSGQIIDKERIILWECGSKL